MLAEHEIEQLEDLLDDALPANEAAALRERLGREPELAGTLAELGAQREARRRVWADLEPGDEETAELVGRVKGSIAARKRRGRMPWRAAAAVAACAVIGFAAGWTIHGRHASGRSFQAGYASVPPHPAGTATAYQVALTDESGAVTAVQNFDSLEKAREFAQDLGQWQERQRQLRNGAAVVVADRF
jgi:anti-sigma factor RsiW